MPYPRVAGKCVDGFRHRWETEEQKVYGGFPRAVYKRLCLKPKCGMVKLTVYDQRGNHFEYRRKEGNKHGE